MLLKLIQNIWDTGEIPHKLLLTIVVLISKGNIVKYQQETGLLEVLWKISKRVPDERMSAIEVHDFLQGFCTKRGCVTKIMEAKLV